MADAMISVVVERVAAIIEDQIRNEVNLVRGVEKELLDLSDKLNTIKNVLDDAEKKGVNDQSVKTWLKKLNDTAYEMDDILDEWNYTLLDHKNKIMMLLLSKRYVAPSSHLHAFAKLDQILEEKLKFDLVISPPKTLPVPNSWRVQSTSSIEFEKVYGRREDRDNIVRKLINRDTQIVSIVGMGGLGKTTLAQLVYHDTQIKDCFELTIWICVSDPFDVAEIARGIVASVTKESIPPHTDQLELVLEKLKDCITGKKFLLVLDDVWTEEYNKWKLLQINLKHGAPTSKILVTTRNVRVAKMMGTAPDDVYRPRQLSDEECWSLMCSISLSGMSEEECGEFEDVGKKIASKCNGLPLAVNVLGSLLINKSSLNEWENVLDSEIWKLDKAEEDLFPHLVLSYNELSPALKHCFSYCAVYPKDSRINVERVIQEWMALGYLGSVTKNGGSELKGREYFNNLAMRCLFQDFEESGSREHIKWCKMHDIVHDFAQFVWQNNERGEMRKKSCQLACDPLLGSHVQVYRSIYWDKRTPLLLCDCLTSVRVLRFESLLVDGPPQGMKKLIHLRWLDLSGNALSEKDCKIICRFYFLQTLLLAYCSLEEILGEIGNLVKLRRLDLSGNDLKELPESMCGLVELQSLNITKCWYLNGLPEGIHRLQNLQHLLIEDTCATRSLPQGVGELSGLRTLGLTTFEVGSDCNKLGLLQKLNHLTGDLDLKIYLKCSSDLEELVEDAREAQLRNKIHIQNLSITFEDKMNEREWASSTSSLWMDVIEALEPNIQKLQKLEIWGFGGSMHPHWMSSPLNLIKEIHLSMFSEGCSLPAMGRLPFLELLSLVGMEELKAVGREFLGIESSSFSSTSNHVVVAFPKLKVLQFEYFRKWEDWEDITAKEEESEDVSIMPCLTQLNIFWCKDLKKLPHRLLRKTSSSLQILNIRSSSELIKRYEEDKKGSAWRSISQYNPKLQLVSQ
ncbi:putative disease resistance protein RGA3 [Salvia miltiorrhiza]|uniref:putative disease resistance protein RGA3 n=1 Tax=Salvia miltiorrhiza TaxID=226208 RepID=UPI0025ACC858|nr:putative disease resistance protein RGA3 [Salvia miltiorrhiza]